MTGLNRRGKCFTCQIRFPPIERIGKMLFFKCPKCSKEFKHLTGNAQKSRARFMKKHLGMDSGGGG